MTRWYEAVALMAGLALATTGSAQQAPCPTPASTFELIQRGVFEQHGCTQDFCHGAGMQAGLDLRAGAAYASLLHHDESAHADEAEQSDDHEYKLVDPGRPDESLLWLVLAAKTLQRPNVPAEAMPIGALPLSRDELEAVDLWIAAGAPEQGVVPQVADKIDACPQSSSDDYFNLPACDPNDTSLLLPNLVPQPPQDIRLTSVEGHRIIYFSTIIANTGEGPLIIQAASRPSHPGQLMDAEQVILRQGGAPCSHPAGAIRFGDDGKSWQYAQMANFELRKEDPMTGDTFALRTKTYFCLLDTDALRPADNMPRQYEAHCTDDIGRMGISVGWADTYHRVFPGQWLDLDADPEQAVPAGSYYLVNIANPADVLWETDRSLNSNMSYTRVKVNAQDPDAPVVQPTPVAQPTPAEQSPARLPRTRVARPPRTASSARQPHPARASAASRPEHPTRLARAPHTRAPRAVRTRVEHSVRHAAPRHPSETVP